MPTAISKRRWCNRFWSPCVLILLVFTVRGTHADELEGHFEVGARAVDVDGDETKYRQYIDLEDGARLFSFAVRFVPEEPKGQTPDVVDVRVSGLGGEPYESISISASKSNAYRFKYDRHVSDYFYEDLLLSPGQASVEQSTGGDFHHFDYTRSRDDVSLRLDLAERARADFDFGRYGKQGDSTTTLDVEREEFELAQPIDEVLDTYGIGFQYDWDKVTLLAGERWQRYDNNSSAFLPGFSLGSEPSEPTELDYFFLDQPYEHDTREHKLGLLIRPTKEITAKIDVLTIDSELDLHAAESAQGTDFLGNPFVREARGAGDLDRDTTLIDASLDYMVTERVQVGLQLRRYNLDQEALLDFDDAQTATSWKLDSTSAELSAEVLVVDGLWLSAGWSTEQRELSMTADGAGLVGYGDVDTDRDGYSLRVDYRPDRRFSLTLALDDNRIDDPFTLASATDSRRYTLRGRYRFDNGVMLSASHKKRDLANENSDWESSSEQNDVRIGYTGARFVGSVGYASIELDREIDQWVTGGFRQDLFSIDYSSDADFWDAAARFAINDLASINARARRYENNGGIDVERDDVTVGLDYVLAGGYMAGLRYRNIDYSEEDLEQFDANILELSLRVAW